MATSDTPIGSAMGVLENRSRLPLFNTPLQHLILDEKRCSVCHMDCRLGVPTMVLAMLSYLSTHLDTPGLFRQRVSPDALAFLRRCLEREEGIPACIGTVANTPLLTHTVAQTLLQWLYELPEPLLGCEHYEVRWTVSYFKIVPVNAPPQY